MQLPPTDIICFTVTAWQHESNVDILISCTHGRLAEQAHSPRTTLCTCVNGNQATGLSQPASHLLFSVREELLSPASSPQCVFVFVSHLAECPKCSFTACWQCGYIFIFSLFILFFKFSFFNLNFENFL